MAFKYIPFGIYQIRIPQQKIWIFEKVTKMEQRTIFQEAITRNLEFLSNDKLTIEKGNNKLPRVVVNSNRPLAVMFEWISADKRHFHKYSDLYLERGYDVLAVSLSVWQLLWPTSGSQIVAREALEFLHQNVEFRPLLIHGFSIGGYVWGEVLVHMNHDLEKNKHIIDKIKGQVWDSTPDAAGFYKGFPRAVFPNNALLRLAVEKSIVYHLRIFHDSATKHYLKASDLFHDTPVKAPALLYSAKNDPVASYKAIVKLKEHWESVGMKTYMKTWEKSRHVSHLRLHEKEYIEALDMFLSSLQPKDIREDVHAKL